MSVASAIGTALDDVRAEIAAACARAGRPTSAVTLVAVSKGQPSSTLRAAYAAGQRHFGENYVDEWKRKQAELSDLDDVVWHFVGRVQSGNAKAIAKAALVHGVGSTSQAAALAKEAQKTQTTLPVLFQVNLEGEDTKNGFTAASLSSSWPSLSTLSGLQPRGLMAMPLADDVAVAFDAVVAVRDAVCPALPELSFGMSGDFVVAVEHGATMVRVGTRIFGARA